MKKTVHLAFIYAILAMIGGVFYREFTKILGFEGRTTLSFVHTHLFLLGMIMLLMVSICIKLFQIDDTKKFKPFLYIYNLGVLITSIMLGVRGIFQVNATVLSSAMNGMISGISGIGHILTGVGIIMFFMMLKEKIK